jgi:putative endonuclease
MKQPAIYIVSNPKRTVLYIGVTSHLSQRAHQHREGLIEVFSKQYNCADIVYYELHESMELAILREKQLKRWSRSKKEALINNLNPKLENLYDTLI